MPDPITRYPTPDALAWVAAAVGRGSRVLRGRRLIGGITSAMHTLTVEDSRGRRRQVVLRRWVRWPTDAAARLVRHEARVLGLLADADLPAPRLIAADPRGENTGGVPALLMSRVPGHVHLTPRDPESWLRQMAALLPRIHSLPFDVPAFEPWTDPSALEAPDWTPHPEMWRRAIAAVQEPSGFEACFIHRDYQHFNLLWSRERLTGVVDWVFASTGPPDIDVGHCRLNLAVLFSAEWAERFRSAYEAEAGRRVDPRWDLTALMSYGPAWATFIPKQVGRRTTVDAAGMNARIDELVARVTARL